MATNKTLHRPQYLVASGAVQPAVLEKRRSASRLLVKLVAAAGTFWLIAAVLDWNALVF